jgi:serine/threonine protein kinase
MLMIGLGAAAGLIGLLAVVYLAWWGRRFWHAWRARRVTARAVQTADWTPALQEQVLEYTRLLAATAPEYGQVCLALARRKIDDERALALYENYLTVQRLTPENAPVAAMLARRVLSQPLGQTPAPQALNAAVLVDQLAAWGQADEELVRLRASFAMEWIDTSAGAMRAGLQDWRRLQGAAEGAPLLRYLYACFAAVWPVRRERLWLAEANEPPTEGDYQEFVTYAAEVFRAMANTPPASLPVRQLAIHATYESSDLQACFGQCERARAEFGAPALSEAVWQLWAQCIVQLEGDNWPAYSQQRFAALPASTQWRHLQEIFDHAVQLQPENDQFLTGQAWTYLGAKLPVERALPVYERVLECGLPIAPALEQLAGHYRRTAAWANLERACRAWLPLQEAAARGLTYRWLAEALITGKRPADREVLEQAFDATAADAAVNGALAQTYLALTTYERPALDRLGRLLASPLPPAFPPEQLLALREKFALAWLDSGLPPAEALKTQINRYLEQKGKHPRLMTWAVDTGFSSQQQATLEALMLQRPVERRHCLELLAVYQAQPPTAEALKPLAEAAQSIWAGQASFDQDDCRLAVFIGERLPLEAATRRKLMVALLRDEPAGWKQAASQHLQAALQDGQADAELVREFLTHVFRPDEPEPVHVWALESLERGLDQPATYGLRLLALYDAGIARPGESSAQAHQHAAKLAQELAARCQAVGPRLQVELFPPLSTRLVGRPPESLAEWELDFYLFGIKEDLLIADPASLDYANRLAEHLHAKGAPQAVTVQRWAYDHSEHTPTAAARLFQYGQAGQQVKAGMPFWFDVASLAWRDPAAAEAASAFLVEELLAAAQWGKTEAAAAGELLESPHRARLAPAYIAQIEYGRDHHDDRRLIDLLNDDLELGRGRAELLLALAERREKKRDYSGALEACLLIEESVGSSEDLSRRILGLLPNTQERAKHADRLAGYLKLYRNSFDLLVLMVPLARDPARPLSFDLAYSIIDRWGDLAGQQAARQDAEQKDYAVDPSFVVATKCEVYDLFHDQMTPQDAQAMLRSIGKHSRQALSDEARKRVERIGDEVLFASGQDNETMQILAEILYGLGNLAAATWHFERLAEAPDYHAVAVQSLERIARQLESPLRELPALLAAYRVIADDAHRGGRPEVAEATVKKAKDVFMGTAVQEEILEEDRKRMATQRDAILKLHQSILETQSGKGALTPEQMRDLADVYRLRGLWDKAGRLYSELALALSRKNDRAGGLECAEQVFNCYYKAGKGWWDPGARFLLRILWGRENVPPADIADKFSGREFRIMESVAVLYHSLCVDPNLHLDPARRMLYKRSALQLYERMPFDYIQEREYVRRLMYDLGQATPTIQEPFDLVPHIHEQGRSEIWTGVRYEKQDRLGGGEFAEVFKVLDTQTKQVYAMKLITPAKGRDPKALERFQREGAWLKEIDHPNIVKCYDAGVQEDRQFIIMDCVEGQTLDDLISRRRREIPIPQRLRIFLNVCSAVEFLHNQGLLHRDLHPGNVLVGGKDYETVKLTDFGLATMMDRDGVGKSSRIHGRENYTPPEVYSGRGETTASEVYSLGAMLCFILTGWPRPDATLLRELKSAEYFGLGEVIERALGNEPTARYQRVTELIQAVRQHANLSYDFGAIIQKVTPQRFQQMFELGAELGHGDAGLVYRARDLRLPSSPEVAIKEIASERVRGSLERRMEHFFRIRDLAHPNLVPLQAFFRVDGKLYVVMDLVQGQSLAQLMDVNESQGKRFPPTDSLSRVADVARGLAFVHQHGIVHGCVVPTNIMVEEKTGRARLSDFTASVLFEGDQWHKSAMVRQYNYYLAPEIDKSQSVTPASDVYSLGWLFCHLVTGQRGQLNPGEIFAALEEMGRWKEPQMEAVVQVIEGSTLLDPAQRAYPDAGAFLSAVEKIG